MSDPLTFTHILNKEMNSDEEQRKICYVAQAHHRKKYAITFEEESDSHEMITTA
jgi:hypothetical protein